jgi:radical SAM-linked protein
MRIRINFEKTHAMRYTGHLDLHRAWERTFRRSGLPLAYSQGFHPQPKINLACALPLGFTSQCEVVDVWLEHTLPISDITQALAPALPPGMQIIHIEEIDPHAPSLQTQVQSAEYTITLLENIIDLGERINTLLASESISRERRGKTYDLRSLIEELRCQPDDENGYQRFHARLAAREGATGRPEEVLNAINIPPTSARVHRTKLVFI